MNRVPAWIGVVLIVGMLASCATRQAPPAPAPAPGTPPPAAGAPSGVVAHDLSRWVAVPWSELPGIEADDTHAAWNAWVLSCARPVPPFVQLCDDVRRLSLASTDEQRAWMREHLQPYRVEPVAGGSAQGLLTSYFEPEYIASRTPQGAFQVPLYAPPPGLQGKSPWYTRRQIDTDPAVRAQLAGSEIAWLADPIDAMILHIQGSGRLRVIEPDGSQRLVRLAFAATNNQPYRSPGRWLKDQGEISDATWPGIKAWLAQHPERVQDFLWSNPRVVFFREEPLAPADAAGPRGAQGVALTPGRSIAVDPRSIPYGTPVWMVSEGPVARLQRLVLAQDTGHAIRGAVRADYFAGTGAEAGDLAGRLSQPLRLWVLWPK